MKQVIEARPIKNPLARLFTLGAASGLGLGYMPVASGTWGSLLGLPLGYLLLTIPSWQALLLCAIALVPCSLISGRAGLHWGNSDSGRIVLDEVLGMTIGLLGLRSLVERNGGDLTAIPWHVVLIGFLVFRLLDITKPFPAKTFDRQATGFGVMADDVVVGLYTAMTLRLIDKIWLA